MKYLLTLLLLIFPIFSWANPHVPARDGIDDVISSGLDDLYNLRFADAERKFKQAQNQFPNDIKGYFYESLIYFHSAQFSKDDAEYEKFINISDKVIERCEDILDNDENNFEVLFYKGQSHSYQSLLMLSQNKSLFQAASNGSDGYKILSDVVERNPGFYDAYMGLGLYRIAIGFLPDKFKWLMSVIGFDGDVKEGKRLLRVAKDKGKFTKVDARVYLSLFTLREREEDTGETVRMLEGLVNEYPESPAFHVFYATALQNEGEIDKAIDEANKSLSLNNHSLQDEIKKAAYFVLGNSYFRKNDFQNAAKYFEEHMKYVNYNDRYNISLFHTGLSNELIGNRQKAIDFYSKTRTIFEDERDGDADKLFHIYSQKLINNPVQKFDSLLLVGMNHRYSYRLDEALKVFNSILISDMMNNMSDDNKIRLYMETGHAYTYNKQDDLAIDYFTRCTKLDPPNEKWMVPHAYFELGKIYSRKGNRVKADEMFDKIYDYGEYIFRSFLEIRLRSYREG